MKKQPKSVFAVSVQKQPKVASDPSSFNSLNPAWRIRRVELADPFGWHKLDGRGLLAIREKLADFESMTWNEILIAGKKQNHSVLVSDLSSEARKRLAEIRCIDVDELVSLRLSGTGRVWGILNEGVLTLLWWDPEHRVCPSLKKNT